MLIHGPSIGIGAGITAAVTVAVFLALQGATEDGNDGEDNVLVMIPSDADMVVQPQQQQQSETPSTASMLLENGSPILGNPSAPVTLVEFGDYQCHFCNVFFHETEGRILEDYVDTGKVRIIFKDYHIIGPDSVEASHGAHCAGGQRMFWEYHDILYENWTGENNGWASYENLEGFATEMTGLDLGEWVQCMQDRPHSAAILASNRDAKALGLSATPSFFVIGPDGQANRVVGAQPYEFFAAMFDAKLAGTGLQ